MQYIRTIGQYDQPILSLLYPRPTVDGIELTDDEAMHLELYGTIN